MSVTQTTQSLAAPDTPVRTAFDGDWERLWFVSLAHNWTSLAIMPTEAGIDVSSIAASLVAVGKQHGARSVRFIDAVGARLDDVQRITESLAGMTEQDELVVVAIDPYDESPAALAISRAVSGALLVVRTGSSRLSKARKAVETLKKPRVFGSIVIA